MINLGYARPQAATAIAASLKALGEGAETAALIRRGLKELATTCEDAGVLELFVLFLPGASIRVS